MRRENRNLTKNTSFTGDDLFVNLALSSQFPFQITFLLNHRLSPSKLYVFNIYHPIIRVL